MEVYAVAIEGLKTLDDFAKLPAEIRRAARMAVNATVRRARIASARSMEQQVNFPRGYLSGSEGRLKITKFASDGDLEGRITGRDRPTSLARFVRGQLPMRQKGVKSATGATVEVKPGLARRMPGAFAIRLKNGNIGLAVRTKDGRAPSRGAKLIDNGLYLLYGPSVDQVFVKTREMIKDDQEDYMAREFERLLDARI